MPGLFNVENALCAIATASILNVPYENMYEGDSSYENSYARGRRQRRDRMGRYSRDDAKDEMVQNLRQMMDNAPDEQTRMGIERLMQQMEQ